ncbi:MarR family winged helix-turn-helix transcriptional regulator [Granulosicoccus sp. 3-233]|uniref:MarR family winged helix-turn-helix transcriptional regulator n=1 Tax=Granulosicoccus sp. 3-233 TaxID=3417969 RepID=UPI003D356ABE
MNKTVSKPSDGLLLQDQLCFALYSTSRAITRQYSKLLADLGLTYPQYLAMLVLWEGDGITIQAMASRLQLEGATTTPLIQRLEKLGLVSRVRSRDDERRVMIHLTDKGHDLYRRALGIPASIQCAIGVDEKSARSLMMACNRIRDVIRADEQPPGSGA